MLDMTWLRSSTLKDCSGYACKKTKTSLKYHDQVYKSLFGSYETLLIANYLYQCGFKRIHHFLRMKWQLNKEGKFIYESQSFSDTTSLWLLLLFSNLGFKNVFLLKKLAKNHSTSRHVHVQTFQVIPFKFKCFIY